MDPLTVPNPMDFENLTVERDGAVAVVTINRPKVLNALNTQTMEELWAAIEELGSDESVRAVVLTGS
ncbi:MAG: enoyl-CoA hydratase-related protein, partial [Acidobacteriota bacterium]|nr:enoyl-CoA hydratase-related protein [Acidobacteriota bacterium]